MEHLWAPWRITYIKKINNGACLFCRVNRQKNADRKNYVFMRSTTCFAMLNRYPYNNGHAMIVINRHSDDIDTLSEAETLDLWQTVNRTKNLLDAVLKPHGYNIGINMGEIAGAGIPKHLHIHIVPRWRADTNFMPVITGTKVISQSLSELYHLLCQKKHKA